MDYFLWGDYMKKSCNGCRALDVIGNNSRYKCSLGVNIEQISHPFHIEISVGAKPLADCPKPRTYDELYKLYDLMK